jgi:hypothetical protein
MLEGRLAFEFIFDVFVLAIGVLVATGVAAGVAARFVLLAAVLVFAGPPQARLKAPQVNNSVVSAINFFI